MSRIPKDFLDGIRVLLPLLPGIIPFGMITGAIAAEANLSVAQGLGQSIIVYAGAAQLAATQLIGDGSPLLVVMLTGLVINMRLAIYSASLAPHFLHVSTMRRGVLSYLMTDQSYALSITRFVNDSSLDQEGRYRFYMGGAIIMWIVWQLAAGAGYFLGNKVPENWSLDFFVPLGFLAILVPAIRDKATVVAAVTGASLAAATWSLPFNLGLFIGSLGGILAGYLYEAKLVKPTASSGDDQ